MPASGRRASDMVTFTFYIRDARYSVPTLAIVDAHDEKTARELAAKRLVEFGASYGRRRLRR